jgi:hypothetical protein
MLPALSFATLRSWDEDHRVTTAIRARLSGAVLRVPSVLPITEREELVEALGAFCNWRVEHVAERDSPTDAGRLFLATHARGELVGTPGSLWVVPCEPSRDPRSLELDAMWIVLRDAMCGCFAGRFANTRLRAAIAWAADATDSPSTALRFLDGVLRAWLAQRDASDAALFAAGLAAVVEWLLRGVDPIVSQWVVAIALGGDPALVVGGAAALLGREPAIHRAFDAGLVELYDPNNRPKPDLRRPLEMLSRPDRWPQGTTIELVQKQLEPLVLSDITRVFVRKQRAELVVPLGLVGPKPPGPIVTHAAAIEQACAIFGAESTVRTVVLRGVAGSGKKAVAAHVCARLAPDREAIWVSFANGPRDAWARVGSAMKLEGLRDFEAMVDDGRATPRWVELVFDELRARRAIVVVEEADTVDEADLRHWIPGGAGRCHVLVQSERAQRWLQQSREAIVIDVGPLDRATARALLAAKAPSRADEIERGAADEVIERLGGHMGALALLGARIARSDVPIETLIEEKGDPIPSVGRDAIESLDEGERDVVDALAVCANGAAPIALIEAMVEHAVDARALDKLEQRSMLTVRGSVIELSAIIRVAADVQQDNGATRRERLAQRHAEAVIALFERTANAAQREALVPQLLEALRRLAERLEREEHLRALDTIAGQLLSVPHKNRQKSVRRVIEACDGALSRSPFLALHDRGRLVFVNRLAEAWLHVDGTESAYARARAITLLRSAVADAERIGDESMVRRLEHALGVALTHSRRQEDREEAESWLRRALEKTSFVDEPEDWAKTAYNLSAALEARGDRPHQEIVELLRRASEAAKRTNDVDLQQSVQVSLVGELSSRRSTSEQRDEGYSLLNALVADISKHEHPHQWARVRFVLGSSLLLPASAPLDRVQQAIDLLLATLEVWTESRDTDDWTRTQYWLALGLVARASASASMSSDDAATLSQYASNAARGYAMLGDQEGIRRSIELAERVRGVIAAATTKTAPDSQGPR